MRLSLVFAAAAAIAAPAGAQDAIGWREHNRLADSARVARDWPSYIAHSKAMYEQMHGYPGTLIGMARGEAQRGDTAAALGWLRAYAAMGIVRDMDADSLLAPLRGTGAWRSILEAMERNKRPVSASTLAFALPDSDEIAEDITYDAAAHRFIVSSIRHRRIVAYDERGRATPLVAEGHDGVWSLLAVAVDAPRHVLWASTAAMAQASHYAPADSGRSGVVKYDLGTGALLARYELPRDGKEHVLGDMVVSPSGEVFVADAVRGGLYVVRAGATALQTLVAPGTLASPQEAALAPDGRLFVADYLRGIAIVDSRTGAVSWLAHAPSVALNGIDGLVFDGRALIAVQNGTDPRRVLRIELDQPMRRVVKWSVLEANRESEPTHGVIVGRDFYFIANSGWGAFNDDGTLRSGAIQVRPTIRKLRLR